MDTQQPLPTSAQLQQHQSQQPQLTNGSLSKYDEAERVRQRMEGLRKHHNESADIYNRTQPIINEQIHEETMKYLKNGQVNGTKTKGQKPRAPKRQRNPPKTQQITLYPPRVPQQQQQQQQSMHIQQQTNPQHQLQPQQHLQTPPQHQMQPQQLQTPPQQHQMQPQQPQHHQHMMSPQQQQQHFKYQQTPNMQYQHPTMQNQLPYHGQQQPPHSYHGPPQHSYHGQPQPPQQIYQQQPQQQQQPATHLHFAQHPSHHSGNLNPHQHKYMLPNDLDLNLQAGLECDVDSLIKHEMSVEGQLDFNHDLLLKLDNHFELG